MLKKIYLIVFSVLFSIPSIAGLDYSKLRKPSEPSLWEQASAKSAEYINPTVAMAVSVVAPAILGLSAVVSTPETARFKRIAAGTVFAVSALLAALSFNGVQK